MVRDRPLVDWWSGAKVHSKLSPPTMASKGQRANKKNTDRSKPKVTSEKHLKNAPVAKAKASIVDNSDEESANGDTGSEPGDVDEEGMNRLLELLGDDGLDDFAKYQLGLVSKSGDSEDDSDFVANMEDVEDQGEDSDDENEEQGQKEPESTVLEALEDVDLEDVSSVDEDAVPRQKILINNAVCLRCLSHDEPSSHRALSQVALERIRDTIKLSALPWTETLAVTYDQTIDVDVNDDLNRELALFVRPLHYIMSSNKHLATNRLYMEQTLHGH
jgi:rRNA-processing protein EBP2